MKIENKDFYLHSAELQQRWHGWGSPIGLGVGLISVGIFIHIVAKTVLLFF